MELNIKVDIDFDTNDMHTVNDRRSDTELLPGEDPDQDDYLWKSRLAANEYWKSESLGAIVRIDEGNFSGWILIRPTDVDVTSE